MTILRWVLVLSLAAAAMPAPVLARDRDPGYTLLLRIPFRTSSDELGPRALARLEQALPALKADYQDVRIEIAGHTDTMGPDPLNLELSRRRARAVYDYLVANGVDVRFMYEQGYGSSQPIADNDTRYGRYRNRRVELRMMRGPGPGDLVGP